MKGMNRGQLLVVVATLGTIGVMCLFPPNSYKWIGRPYNIDVEKLILQILGVSAVGAALFFLTKIELSEMSDVQRLVLMIGIFLAFVVVVGVLSS